MNISPVSFGRTAVMSCTVQQDGTDRTATMYKMDTKNRQDYKDVMYSKHTTCIKPDFENDSGNPTPYKEYYLLQDDKTKEVIACAETSKHYTQATKHAGTATVVNEMNVNEKYSNAVQPFFAYLAHDAKGRKDVCVSTAITREDVTDLPKAKLSELRNGDWYLPASRFSQAIEQAKLNSDIIFLA